MWTIRSGFNGNTPVPLKRNTKGLKGLKKGWKLVGSLRTGRKHSLYRAYYRFPTTRKRVSGRIWKQRRMEPLRYKYQDTWSRKGNCIDLTECNDENSILSRFVKFTQWYVWRSSLTMGASERPWWTENGLFKKQTISSTNNFHS